TGSTDARGTRWNKSSTTPPETPAVWHAVLQNSLAAGTASEAQRALHSIPAEHLSAPEQWSLRAWFAANRNDPAAERSALEQVVEVEPGNTAALDRLAALALQAGQPDGAAALRRLLQETLREKERYRRLLIEDRSPIPRVELLEP